MGRDSTKYAMLLQDGVLENSKERGRGGNEGRGQDGCMGRDVVKCNAGWSFSKVGNGVSCPKMDQVLTAPVKQKIGLGIVLE